MTSFNNTHWILHVLSTLCVVVFKAPILTLCWGHATLFMVCYLKTFLLKSSSRDPPSSRYSVPYMYMYFAAAYFVTFSTAYSAYIRVWSDLPSLVNLGMYFVYCIQSLLQLSAQGVTSTPAAASYAALLCLLELTRKLKVRTKLRGGQSMRIIDKLTLSMAGRLWVVVT